MVIARDPREGETTTFLLLSLSFLINGRNDHSNGFLEVESCLEKGRGDQDGDNK